ncbi:MAG: SurA N-terminal domain-containing protein [Hyphomicrobiaceae bacterium]
MLTSLRKGAQTWIAAVFIFLLAGSFAVWGIADIFGGGRFADVATVGDQKISQQQYRNLYNNEIQRASARFGRAISREQARLLGIDQRVLGQLLGTAALDLHSKELKLGISDEAVAARIKRDPAFQSLSGGFDRARFRETLRQAGYSEGAFIARQKQGLVREQLTKTVTGDVTVPKTLLDAVNLFQNETRAVDYFIISPEVIGKLDEPDDAALKSYYDANKRTFTAPAYRKVDMIVLQPKDFRDKVEVTDAEIKESFDARSNEFNTPEKRTVEQITFPDEAAAQKGHDALKGGKDFGALADEVGREDRYINYGSVTPAGIIDKAISEAAFKLEKGKFSAPIKGSLSTAIVHVVEIAPAVTKTFNEVKDQVRDGLVAEKAAGAVADLFDNIEDDRAKGLTLGDIAAKRAVQPLEVAAIDAQGNGPDGLKVKGVPENQNLYRGINAAEIDIQNEPVELTAESFAWYEVRGITPEKLKPFDTVKDEVKKAWVTSKTREAVAALGKDLVKRIEKGETIGDVAKDKGREVQSKDDVKRVTRSDDLPSGAVGQIFTLAKGGAGSGELAGGTRRVVFQLKDIKAPAAPTEEEATAVRNAMQSQIGDDLVAQYLVGLQSRYEVNVNEQALEQATQPGGGYGGQRPAGY